MKKLAFALIALAVVGLIGFVTWQALQRRKAEGGPGRRGPASTPVAVAPVRRGTVRDIQLFTGTLLPRWQFVVAPKIAGRLEQLHVDIGDRVTSGTPLAELDDDEFARQEEMAQAELEVAEANVEEWVSTQALVARELERVRTLREKQIASVADLDAAEAQARATAAKYRVALAQVDQKKAALKAAQIRRSYTRIAPEWTGGAAERVVGERFVNQSDTLRANDPIVTLLDVSVMTAVIGVTERNYARMHVGQSVTIYTDAHGDRPFTGKVARIAPLVRERSREARVEIEIDNADGLLVPGLFVRAEVEFQRRDDAIIVPSTAVVRRGEQRGVFVPEAYVETEDDVVRALEQAFTRSSEPKETVPPDTAPMKTGTRARFIPLKLGIVQRDEVEVLEPADLSGSVIVLGQHLLEDKAEITIPALEAEKSKGAGQPKEKVPPSEAVKASAAPQGGAEGGR